MLNAFSPPISKAISAEPFLVTKYFPFFFKFQLFVSLSSVKPFFLSISAAFSHA